MILERNESERLRSLHHAEVARGGGITHDLFIEGGQGSRAWDADGREYLDFVGGIGVLTGCGKTPRAVSNPPVRAPSGHGGFFRNLLNLGHRHPRVVAALQAQLDRFTHTCFQVAMYEGYLELARRLNRLTPGNALATLDALAEDGILENARYVGDRTRSALVALARADPAIVDVRGLGADAQRVLEAARERGLLLPLTITGQDLEAGLEILAQSCAAALTPVA